MRRGGFTLIEMLVALVVVSLVLLIGLPKFISAMTAQNLRGSRTDGRQHAGEGAGGEHREQPADLAQGQREQGVDSGAAPNVRAAQATPTRWAWSKT